MTEHKDNKLTVIKYAENGNCSIHKELMCDEHGEYYGCCMYCILSGCMYFDEFDSFREIANRVVDIVKAGFKDEEDDLDFTPISKEDIEKLADTIIVDNTKYYVKNNYVKTTTAFVRAYMTGREMAMAKKQ